MDRLEWTRHLVKEIERFFISWAWSCYIKWYLQPPPSKNTKSLKKKEFFCFSDWLYRNRKSHGILGCLEAIFWVLGLIYGSNRIESSCLFSSSVKQVEIKWNAMSFLTQLLQNTRKNVSILYGEQILSVFLFHVISSLG